MSTLPADVVVHGTSGPAVLLVPGGIAPCDGFFPGLADGLVEDPGCRVVVHDRPGTGRSGTDGAFADAADHLAGVLDRTGVGPAVVVGQSLGGAVALLLAVEHPEVVRGLVLLDPTPVNDPRVCGRLERTLLITRGVAAVTRIPRHLSPRHPPSEAPDLARLAAAVRGTTRRSRRLADEVLPRLPSVLVTADRDPDDPTARAHARLATGLGADVVTWPGATHDVHTDDPARILSTVRAPARPAPAYLILPMKSGPPRSPPLRPGLHGRSHP